MLAKEASMAGPICRNGHPWSPGQVHCHLCGAPPRMQWGETPEAKDSPPPTPICRNGHSWTTGQVNCQECGAPPKIQWAPAAGRREGSTSASRHGSSPRPPQGTDGPDHTSSIQGVDDSRFRSYVVHRLISTEFYPWAGRSHGMLVPAEVLIDLLLGAVPPSASDMLLEDINSDLARGNRMAVLEKRLLDHWVACKRSGRITSLADEVTEDDVDGLVRASKELVGALMLLAFTSDPRRMTILHDALNGEVECNNFLAAGCQVIMNSAFGDLQSAAKAVREGQGGPSET